MTRVPGRKSGSHLCRFCRSKWAQDREGLCRGCANALKLQTSTNYVRVPNRVDAFEGRLLGWPIGAYCPVRPPIPKRTYVERLHGRDVVLEVVWNGP